MKVKITAIILCANFPGTDEYHKELAGRRAGTVKDYLATRGNIPEERLVARF
ncbi:MAG: hypothetical protein WCY59_06235 [Anaerovoracaceae bacterium]